MKMNEIMPDLATIDDLKKQQQGQKSQASKAGKFSKPTTSQGTQGTQGTTQDTARDAEHAKDKQIRTGGKISLPTADGDEQEFKITRDMGNEVEIENPEGRNNPNEPNKLVYDKKQLRRGMANGNENNRA